MINSSTSHRVEDAGEHMYDFIICGAGTAGSIIAHNLGIAATVSIKIRTLSFGMASI